MDGKDKAKLLADLQGKLEVEVIRNAQERVTTVRVAGPNEWRVRTLLDKDALRSREECDRVVADLTDEVIDAEVERVNKLNAAQRRERCEKCQFYHSLNDLGGQCRKHPPTVTSNGKSHWPLVDTTSWCGDFA